MTDKMQYVIGILISVVMAFAYLGLTETETETQTKRQQALADPSVQQTFSAEASNRRSVGKQPLLGTCRLPAQRVIRLGPKLCGRKRPREMINPKIALALNHALLIK